MSPAERMNHALNLNAAHAYYTKGGTWYHRLKQFPGVLFDEGGYIRFETEHSYHHYPGVRVSLTHDNHVHVPAGLWNLVGYHPFSDTELALLLPLGNNLVGQDDTPTTEQTLRKKRQIDAIQRNQTLVKEIKKLYKDTCQLCGERIQARPNRYYSEVHHIKPLGQPHNGPDHKSNVLCVCPNHHTLLDFFAIMLNTSEIIIKDGHHIDEAYIAYHNQRFEYFNPS
jgi:5-methylcytosine-specific restriction protein A